MKNTKAIKKLLVTTLCAFFCAFAVGVTLSNNSFALAEGEETGSEQVHVHDFTSGAYNFDLDGHWKQCATCSEQDVNNVEVHNFVDNACVCGIKQTTISFDSDGGTSVNSITDVMGKGVTAPTAPEKEGHVFNGWYLSDSQTAYEFDVMPDEDITLIAKWEKESYAVKYDLNYSGSVNAPSDDTVSYGDALSVDMLPTPEREGYTFIGWFTDQTSGAQIGVDITAMPDVGEQITIYARWQANTYQLTINYYKVDTTIQMQPKHTEQVVFGENYSVDNPIITGYHTNNSSVFGKMDQVGGKTIDVYFYPNTNTEYKLYSYLEEVEQGTFSVNPQIDTYYGTTEVSVNTPTNSKYNGFILDANHPSNVLNGQIAPDGSLVLIGYYIRKEYTITINTMGADEIDSITKRMGEAVTAPTAPSKTGYIFGGWYDDIDCKDGDEYVFDKMAGRNVTIYAKWTPITYSIVYDKNDDGATGTMQVNSRAYDDGKELLLAEFIKTGYKVIGWATEPNGQLVYENRQVLNLTETDGEVITLYAVWEAKKIAIYSDKSDEMQSLEVANEGRYDSPISISWQIGDEIGYTYTFHQVTVYSGMSENGTILAQFTTGTSGEYVMDDLYYDTIFVKAVASRVANRYQVAFMFHDGDTNYTRHFWAEYGSSYRQLYLTETGSEYVAFSSLPYYTYRGHTYRYWTSEYIEPDGKIPSTIKRATSSTIFKNDETTDVTQGDTVWHAYWEINTYEVTVDYRNRGTGQMLLVPYTEKVKYNTEYTIEHPTIWGYETNEPTVTGVMDIENLRIKIYYDLVTYTYSFDFNDGVTAKVEGTYDVENDLVFPKASRSGYVFKGYKAICENGNWSSDELYNLTDTKHRFSGDVTFSAVWELEDVVITANPESYRKTYDGTNYELTVGAEHTLSNEYALKYQWYKDGKIVDGETNRVILLKNVVDSGKYVCEVIITDGESTQNAFTSSAVVEISKATYDMSKVTFTDATMVANGDELNLEIKGTLPEGVSVSYVGNGNSKGGVYEVIANFTGDDNHHEISSMTATLTIRSMGYKASVVGESKPRIIIRQVGGMNPNFKPEVKQYNSGVDIPEELLNRGEQIETIYNVCLMDGETEVQPESELTIKILIPQDLRGEKFRIMHKHGEEFAELAYEIDKEDSDYVVVKTEQLSEFIFLYKQTDIMWLIVLLACIFGAEIIIIAVLSSKFSSKKNVKLKSVSPLALLALFVFPVSGVKIAIALGVLVLLGGIVIEIISSRLRKKK